MSVSSALAGFFHVLMPAVFSAQIDLADIAARAESDAGFRAASADVQNWRIEAARHLALSRPASLLILVGARPDIVPRCVKLNNYWCIKGKGWTGQLGSDGSGHAAFVSVPAAARAAAVLLRHYYVDLHRRSAIEITSHWAPDRCGPNMPRAASPSAATPSAPRRPMVLDVAKMTPRERMATFDKIIAARQKAAAAQYRQWLQFVKAANSGTTVRMPPVAPVVAQPVVRPVTASVTPAFCGFEVRRISSYARRALRGIAQTPTEDLQLFTSDGRSTWRAARMMLNMAAVEIGPKSVEAGVVDNALQELDAEMAPPTEKAARNGTVPSAR